MLYCLCSLVEAPQLGRLIVSQIVFFVLAKRFLKILPDRISSHDHTKAISTAHTRARTYVRSSVVF